MHKQLLIHVFGEQFADLKYNGKNENGELIFLGVFEKKQEYVLANVNPNTQTGIIKTSKKEAMYSNGKLQYAKTFQKDGNLLSKTTFHEGELEEHYELTYVEGDLKEMLTYTFKNGNKIKTEKRIIE